MFLGYEVTSWEKYAPAGMRRAILSMKNVLLPDFDSHGRRTT
jgi:hypothetical protein